MCTDNEILVPMDGSETSDAAVEHAVYLADRCDGSVHGTVHRTIEGYIEDNDVDSVVMGTHGRQGVGRHLLGSVTERIIRTVDVPVVAVTEAENSEE